MMQVLRLVVNNDIYMARCVSSIWWWMLIHGRIKLISVINYDICDTMLFLAFGSGQQGKNE